ncbi:hypothetical protein DMENIID0001_120300 [Sergentomyia squamirostris]
MDFKASDFTTIIEELQKTYGLMQNHLQTYDNLLHFWMNQAQSCNMLVDQMPLAEAMLKDFGAVLGAVNVFNSAASLVNISSFSQEGTRAVKPLQFPPAPPPETRNSKAAPTKMDEEQLFTFPKIQMEDGEMGKCIIATKVNESLGFAYITVVTEENQHIFCNLKDHCLKNGNFPWIPPSNTIFGYHDTNEDHFFRAVCVKNDQKFSGDSIDIFLVDFGEYTKMGIGDPFYKLIGVFNNLPGQARLAKILQIDNVPFDDTTTMPDDTKWIYQVVGLTEQAVYIKLFSQIDESVDGDLTNCLLHPPTDFASDEDNDSNRFITSSMDLSQISSTELPQLSSMELSEISSKEICHESTMVTEGACYGGQHRSDSAVQQSSEMVLENAVDDLEESESDDEGTSNAVKAVMGFVPRDDRDYCQFFDPKTLGCFKGSNCRKIHLPKDETGWTEDTTPVKTTISSAPLPEVGAELKGLVTCVINPEFCYVHLNIESVFRLFLINDHIDKLVQDRILLPFKKKPNKFELVTAFYEGHWYRAQIVDFTTGRKCRVRYMDYGNIKDVSMSELREWCSLYDHTPYFAHRVRIANVKMINQNNVTVKATKYLQNVLMESTGGILKKIDMKIISVDPDIEVSLFDAEGYDIGENMVALELVNYRQI